ncbi:hypothetical protein [Thalassoglobus polymorphus]|uniref:Uncharacterized protein n=1 Tax=Thalassoglobus polymorphus TaxID=2527994 RepID=A0A517QPY9_9PLAN|nr:hypothetical protein [Thalassoglobus polymorphus]QDT33691.1 hypothetical protein Mal48_29450 [Thalassoglobus polymorphus]
MRNQLKSSLCGLVFILAGLPAVAEQPASEKETVNTQTVDNQAVNISVAEIASQPIQQPQQTSNSEQIKEVKKPTVNAKKKSGVQKKPRRSKVKATKNLLNFNFAYDPEEGDFNGAVGSSNDQWNFIDYGQQKLQQVRFADGTESDIEVNVSENDGEWGITGDTGIYHGYIYHNCRCVDLSVSLKYLPAGIYEVYVFAHGDAPNQNAAIEVESGSVKLTGKTTLNDGTWNFRSKKFQDENQYVRYVAEVEPGSEMTITSKRDGSNYSMFNAIQLKRIAKP